MVIGVISDTHDNINLLAKALAEFRARGVSMVLHAGDLENTSLLREFSGFRLYLVRGNNDPSLSELNSHLEQLGQPQAQSSLELQIDGKKLFLFHGDNVPLFRQLVDKQSHDYIIKGHTHFSEDYRRGQVRVLNPGALSRAETFSFATLDVKNDHWNLFEIARD